MPKPKDYYQKKQEIDDFKQKLSQQPLTKEEKKDRRELIRSFTKDVEPLQAKGFNIFIDQLEKKAIRMNGAAAGKYELEYKAVAGDLELLKLAYYTQAKGYTIKGIEIEVFLEDAQGDIDLIATKGNTLLVLFESKTGKNVRTKDLVFKTAVVYGAFVSSDDINDYVSDLNSDYQKKLILHIPDALYHIGQNEIDYLNDGFLANFGEWKFLRNINDLNTDII